jgi:O-antigen ligase
MKMMDYLIKVILFFLLIVTPLAFGATEIWAFSIMELGILAIIIFWAIQNLFRISEFGVRNLKYEIVFLSLFLVLILFQMIPIPPGIMKIISPKTYELRHLLSISDSQRSIQHVNFPISFVPFATRIEFFKWLTLSGLFLFLLYWNSLKGRDRVTSQFLVLILLMGVFESLYGMFEFFSGHRHILHLDGSSLVSAVTGTFINRNYFAGYLLMVIPLSVGYLFSKDSFQKARFMNWRHRLSSLDGKTLLIAFSIIVMIIGLLFSASRMGILSLLLSFSFIVFFFKDRERRERKFSGSLVLILGLALLWAAWIGLDAVISRFFTTSEDFKGRWMIWANTFQILRNFPLFGSGLGTFSQIFPMYRSFHIQGFVTHAENDYLQLASEVGFIGIGLLLILFIFLFFKIVSGIRSLSPWEPQRFIRIGGLVGILALMFHSLVERNIQVPANAFLFTFILALVLQPISQGGSSHPRKPIDRL